MKVLHIIDSGGFYGAEVMLVELCLEQRKSGLDAQVLSIGSPGQYEKPLETRLREQGVPCHIWRTRLVPNFRAAASWARWAVQQGFNVLHSHGYKGNILFGFLPRGIRKLPLIATLHGWTRQPTLNRLRLYEWLDSIAIRFLDAIVVVNPLMREQPEMSRLGQSMVHVVPNGLGDQLQANDVVFSEKLARFRNGGILLGAVGRLSQEKGFDTLIEAFDRLRKEGIPARLAILGEGGLRPSLEALVERLGLRDHVYMPGYIPNAGNYIGHFDLFVNSSLTEGLPMTLLEAMRCQCPIVATNLPTLRYLTEEGKLAVLAEPGSEEGLAQALMSALRDPSEATCRAKKAQSLFAASYTSGAMEKAYRNVYETVLWA